MSICSTTRPLTVGALAKADPTASWPLARVAPLGLQMRSFTTEDTCSFVNIPAASNFRIASWTSGGQSELGACTCQP